MRLVEALRDEPCEVFIAVHATKTAASTLAAAARSPRPRIFVLLAGTDVYPAIQPDAATRAALQAADVILALQPHALDLLPAELRPRAHTLVQSATALPAPREATFRVCMLAHLRPVKDPLLPFVALARIPAANVEFVLAGRAMTDDLATAVRAAVAADPRCRWLGEVGRRAARGLLASSHLLVVPSAAEGGANVVSEAIAAGTPVLATRIPGNTGLLGDDWPGLFPVGDAAALARLIARASVDAGFYTDLAARTRARQPMVDPAHECAAWQAMLDGTDGGGGAPTHQPW